jgi:hypothetical protein
MAVAAGEWRLASGVLLANLVVKCRLSTVIPWRGLPFPLFTLWLHGSTHG